MAAGGRGGRVPGDVETVGIGEDGRVPAGGGHQDDHAVTAGEGVPADSRLGERDPHRELGGRVVAEHLLDGRRGELRSFAQQSELVGIAQQSDHSVADEVDARLHARDQQEHADAEDLGCGEDLALLLHPDEHAQQVIGGVRPPLPDQGVQVGDDLLAGSAPLGDVVGRQQVVRVGATGDRQLPVPQRRPVLFGDAQQPTTDHGDGQRRGQVPDDVDLAGLERGIDQPAHQLVDHRRETCDHAGAECLVDQPAQPPVIGRVHPDEGAGQGCRLIPERAQPILVAVAPVLAPQDRSTVVVPADQRDRDVVEVKPGQPGRLADPLVARVRVGPVRRIEPVEGDVTGTHRGHSLLLVVQPSRSSRIQAARRSGAQALRRSGAREVPTCRGPRGSGGTEVDRRAT